ncbi:MAG: sulfatase-like hydrolase/transferase [Acidimicrobiales bacterium]
MSSRPNVVIFMPDQQRADAVGAFGNTVVQTPNIDALAARGMRFDNAWGQHSVCGPSRVSLMTGWYPHVAGHRTLDNLLTENEPNMLRLLRDGGYQVCLAGNRGDVFAAGVTEASTDVCGYIVEPAANLFESLSMAHPEGHRMFQAFYFGRQGDKPRLDGDEAAVQTAIAWIDEVSSRDQPFALWVPLVNPHPPFMVEDPWFSLHDRADVPLPIPRDAGVGKPGFMAEYRRRYGWDELDEADFREITATYYGMVSRTDDQLGRVVQAVDRAGELDNTIFVYLTDHGEYLGDFGLVEKWPSGLDPSLVRNPLIVAGPGVTEGSVCSAGVELIDVLPTLLEVGDIESSHTHFGRSLTPLFANPGAEHRAHVFSEGGFSPQDVDLFEAAGWIYQHKADIQRELPELVGKAQAIRSPQFTYVYRQCESDELYLRDTDPHEIVNVVDDPRHGDILAELKGHLLDWLVATSDVIPWNADPRFPEIPHGWR